MNKKNLKNLLILLIVFIVAFAWQGYKTFSRTERIRASAYELLMGSGDEASDIHFYNLGDKPPAKAYMSIFFKNLSPSDWAQVEKWHDEMIIKLQAMGGVHTKRDYEKITPLIAEYSAKFVTTKANYIAIEFPREKKGILLVNRKRQAGQ